MSTQNSDSSSDIEEAVNITLSKEEYDIAYPIFRMANQISDANNRKFKRKEEMIKNELKDIFNDVLQKVDAIDKRLKALESDDKFRKYFYLMGLCDKYLHSIDHDDTTTQLFKYKEAIDYAIKVSSDLKEAIENSTLDKVALISAIKDYAFENMRPDSF